MNCNEYERIYNNARVSAGTPNGKLTLEGFRERCALSRRAIMMAKEKLDSDKERLFRMFKMDTFLERKKPLEAAYDGVRNAVVAEAQKDLQAVMDAKRKQFSDCLGAPSEEQLRLLQALSMRTSVSATEIAAVADKLNNNINALRVLGDIAERNNVVFPDYGNAGNIEHDLEIAQRHAEKMLNNIDCDEKNLDYAQTLFYNYAGSASVPEFGELDGDYFTAAQAPTPKGVASSDASEIPEGKEANGVRVYLNGSESILCLCQQFGVRLTAVKAANPGVDIHNLVGVDSIVIPAERFTIAHGGRGYASVEQVVPTYIEPAPKTDAE